MLRQIELRGQSTVLGITDPYAVTPQMEGAIHAVESDSNLLFPEPILGKGDRALIATCGVVVRYPWWVTRKRVLHIGINRSIEPLQLPVTGY